MTPEEEKELVRICESYTDEAIDFNTDLEDHLKQFISKLLQQREKELVEKVKILPTPDFPTERLEGNKEVNKRNEILT